MHSTEELGSTAACAGIEPPRGSGVVVGPAVLDRARITYGLVRNPEDAATDPQLLENDIIVPLEGAGGNLTRTVTSPLRIHGMRKVAARCAPELGEHNDEILGELGVTAGEIGALQASGAVPHSQKPEPVNAGGVR